MHVTFSTSREPIGALDSWERLGRLIWSKEEGEGEPCSGSLLPLPILENGAI